MRKLMWFALGFGAGCALCAYLLPRQMLAFMAVSFGVVGILFAVFGGKWTFFGRPALVLLGCALAAMWFQGYYHFYLNDAVAVDAETLTARIHATDYSYETDYGSAINGDVVLNGKTYHAKAYLKDTVELTPGMEIAGDFRFRVTTPDGEKAATYHQGQGVFLLLYQSGEFTATDGEQTWQDKIAVLRRNMKNILETAFPEDASPFAKALLLGDTQDLGYEVDTDFKVSGIRHVVAVSGLHVSILFALLSALTLKNRYLTALVGFPMLFLFAALAGFTPSVTRSCLMLSLTLLGLLLEKNYDGPTALSFAALVMLGCNPLTITNVGFQLSVGSVAGIYAFAAPISGWITGLFGQIKGRKAKLVKWLAASVSITLSAMVCTVPLCALYFGTVSLVGVVTNLLTLWMISFIFYGILAVCLLGLFLPGAAGLAAWVIAWPIRCVLLIAKLMADIPLAAVYTKSEYIVYWLVFVYVLLAVFWISWNRKPIVLLCVGALGLCFALLASWYRPMTDEIRLTVLDVGQGQSLIVQTEGRTFLVDCGGDSETAAADTAAATLLSQGIAKLDGVIVTHGDRDHAGGVPGLLSRVDTRLLILPGDGAGLQDTTAGEVVYPDRDMVLTAGDTKITVFVPRFGGTGNENSLCVLFDTEKCDILITGDRNAFGERSLLRNSYVPDVDVLIAGHHGSKASTSQELLDAVEPEIVCISVSADNHYGHPSPEVLQRLQDFGCAVYRTDLNGDILIRR